MERLPTGVSVLDRELDGGIPAGSVIALTAAPASQSELFLNTFSDVRETLYLTTLRSVESVETGFERAKTGPDNVTVQWVDESNVHEGSTDVFDSIADGGTVIVDPVDPLETLPRAVYTDFLTDVRDRVEDVDGVAVLHALKGSDRTRNRAITEHMADIVFDLRTTVTGTDVENRLIVPKFRGGAAPDEPMKLKLTDDVAVDTSRDIA